MPVKSSNGTSQTLALVNATGLATMRAGAQRIQPHQFAGQMETHDLLLALLAGADRLEGAIARNVNRLQGIARPEQALARLHGAPSLDDVIQARQFRRIDAAGRHSCRSRHCEQPRRKRDQVENVGHRHAAHGDTRTNALHHGPNSTVPPGRALDLNQGRPDPSQSKMRRLNWRSP
jgi:hypothetical protein